MRFPTDAEQAHLVGILLLEGENRRMLDKSALEIEIELESGELIPIPSGKRNLSHRRTIIIAFETTAAVAFSFYMINYRSVFLRYRRQACQ